MKKFILGMLCLLLMVTLGFAAESITQKHDSFHGPLCVYLWDWQTDGSGDFTAVESTYDLNGIIVGFETNPGTLAPTDNYDIELKTEGGFDLGQTALQNRDTADTEFTLPYLNGNYTAIANEGKLTFDVENAGATKQGTMRMFYYPSEPEEVRR